MAMTQRIHAGHRLTLSGRAPPERRASGHDGVVAAILVGDRWGREELDPADYLR